MHDNITISHEIADVLRNEILRQRYLSGERLPSERDLAERFEASRGAVREALSQIEQTGLISIQPGGARVQKIETASIAILGDLMRLEEFPDPNLVDQFLQTFASLSALTVKTAIQQANSDQLKQMSSTVVELMNQADDFEAMQPKWREFLDFAADIANNLVVRMIGNDLKAQFVEQMVSSGLKPRPSKKSVDQLFNSLKQSLADRDGELAAKAMELHFDELRTAVSEAIEMKFANNQRQAV